MTDYPVDISDGPVWEPDVKPYRIEKPEYGTHVIFELFSSLENVLLIIEKITRCSISFEIRYGTYLERHCKYPVWMIKVSTFNKDKCLEIINKLYG